MKADGPLQTLLNLPNVLDSLMPYDCNDGVYWGTTMGGGPAVPPLSLRVKVTHKQPSNSLHPRLLRALLPRYVAPLPLSIKIAWIG